MSDSSYCINGFSLSFQHSIASLVDAFEYREDMRSPVADHFGTVDGEIQWNRVRSSGLKKSQIPLDKLIHWIIFIQWINLLLKSRGQSLS